MLLGNGLNIDMCGYASARLMTSHPFLGRMDAKRMNAGVYATVTTNMDQGSEANGS